MLNKEELDALKSIQRKRFDVSFHKKICQITESQLFNGTIIFIIFLNYEALKLSMMSLVRTIE